MTAEAAGHLSRHGPCVQPGLEAVQEGGLVVLGQHMKEGHTPRSQQLCSA